MLSRFLKTTSIAAITAISATGALAQDRMKVVTTFTVLADMASNVAGDAADVVSITKPGAEIHGYEPTPQDIVRASDADLILWNVCRRLIILILKKKENFLKCMAKLVFWALLCFYHHVF